MLTRREFIGAGAWRRVATHAFALPGDKMRYAMSGHQFRGLKPHPETGIKMAAQYGYHGLEPFEDDMPQYLKQPPEVFKKLLDDAGIALCTVGSGGQYLDRRARPGDHREQRGAREIRRVLRLQAPQGESEPARRPGEPERRKRKDPRAQPERSREADDGCGHQVRVPSARVDARRAPARARHGDGADRSRSTCFSCSTPDTPRSAASIPSRCCATTIPRVASIHLKDAEAKYSTARGWRGPAPSEEEHKPVNLYKRLGSGGVDFPRSSWSCAGAITTGG